MGIFESWFGGGGSIDKTSETAPRDDEYWYLCQDCGGTGAVNVPNGLDESVTVSAQCPVCEGRGINEGDADDESYGGIRVPTL